MSFDYCLKVGKLAENRVFEYLATRRNTAYILDCANDKYYQDKDIDFIVQRRDGAIIKYEVKSDSKADDTGNIFFETKSNSNIGCLARSEADWIFYLTTNHNYIFNLNSIRKFIENYSSYVEEVKGGDNAMGYKLPINMLKEHGLINEVEDMR